ncbi:MAG: penicillin-binding transpeptidase domain-containing protein [Candidatus Amoebophilus sp.]
MEFIEKLVANKLNLSKKSQEKTKEIMNREEDWNGWRLYGKTGAANETTGWFIGWIEKEGKDPIIFTQYLDLNDINLNLKDIPIHKSVGLTAKELAKREIFGFLQTSAKK